MFYPEMEPRVTLDIRLTLRAKNKEGNGRKKKT